MRLVKLKIRQVSNVFILEPTYKKRKRTFNIFGFKIRYPFFLTNTNVLEKAVGRMLYITFARRFRYNILEKYERHEVIKRIDIIYHRKELWVVELDPVVTKYPNFVLQQIITDIAEDIIYEWNEKINITDLEIIPVSELEVPDNG